VTGKRHEYQVVVTWTGNLGEGTARYAAYSRERCEWRSQADNHGDCRPGLRRRLDALEP
jgi:hypothetical protein